MMTITVLLVGETKNFIKYETQDMENGFKGNQLVVKLWVPKSEMQGVDPETGATIIAPGNYPQTLEVRVRVE